VCVSSLEDFRENVFDRGERAVKPPELRKAQDSCDATDLVKRAGAREAQLFLRAVGVALAGDDEKGF
jgi:hypothetical protein